MSVADVPSEAMVPVTGMRITCAPGGGALEDTVKVYGDECDSAPAVPVIVYVYVPVEAGAVSDSVELRGGAPLAGRSEGTGSPLGGATESVTVWALPLVRVVDAVAVTAAPGATVALEGESEIAKSKGAPTFTV